MGQLIGEYAGADNIFTEGDRPYLKTTWEILGERLPLSDFFESSRMTTSAETIARELHPQAFGG